MKKIPSGWFAVLVLLVGIVSQSGFAATPRAGDSEVSVPLESTKFFLDAKDFRKLPTGEKTEQVGGLQLALGTESDEPAEVEVIINGSEKHSLKITKEWELKRLDTKGKIETLEIHHRCGKRIYVYEVRVVVLVVNLSEPKFSADLASEFRLKLPAFDVAVYLANWLVGLHEQARPYIADTKTDMQTLAIMRTVADRLKVVANREGDLSEATLDALRNLSLELRKCHPIFMELLGIKGGRPVGIVYLAIENEIGRRLRP